ncbi:hypothetical protein DPMN_006957 [Dreissena polymorpha]|uniref:Uncharacterized protein n=1 Tax=Dreissena polymorpha TaxID=45954 RepID=A0A9D4MWE1_DREPO|nr:hypothetical protein DPMN_006957 [Dreissena polymorpha]
MNVVAASSADDGIDWFYEMMSLTVNQAIQSVNGTNPHSQEADHHMIEANKLRFEIMNAAHANRGQPGQILADKLVQFPEIRHFCGMLDGLAFLPVDDVASGMAYLKQSAPDVLTSVVHYFDATYVSGAFRTVKYDKNYDIHDY